MDSDYTLLPKTGDVPEEADFCILMGDDCMEPYIHPGDKVYIRCSSPLPMQMGVFRYNGKIYIRQFCEDYNGTLHLLCSNPQREECSLHLDRKSRKRCLCLGSVLCKDRLTMPIYR